MTRRVTALLERVCEDDELLAQFRANPRETAASMGVLIDDTQIDEMHLLEVDAVIDVVFGEDG